MYLIFIIVDCALWITLLILDFVLTNKTGYNIECTARDLMFVNFWRILTLIPAIEYVLYERLTLSHKVKLNNVSLLLVLRTVLFNLFVFIFSSFLGIEALYSTRYSSIPPVVYGNFSVLFSTVIITFFFLKRSR